MSTETVISFAESVNEELCADVFSQVDLTAGDTLVLPFEPLEPDPGHTDVFEAPDEDVCIEVGDLTPMPRTRNPSKWRRNHVKLEKDAGLAHTSLRGKKRTARSVGTGCSDKCKRKCRHRFDEVLRKSIFDQFWNIKNHTQQWYYIKSYVRQESIKRRTVVLLHGEDPIRNCTYAYHLPLNGAEMRVCQKMFLSTLGINQTWVRTALKKQNSNNGAIPEDRRGKSHKKSVVSTIIRADVMEHIKSFPPVEGHYTRKNSKSLYLPENLNRRKLHSMYVISRTAAYKKPIATLRQYRDVFKKEFRLKFFKPKKDQCPKCLSWKNKTASEKTEQAAKEYKEHLEAKELSSELKKEDINIVLMSPEIRQKLCVFSCDLEKILICPKGENGDFFYKRKLSVYNFTVFVSGEQKGYCMVWDQTIGSKGCAEITSCLWYFMKMKIAEGIREFHIYSDNCSAQNKNQFLFSMYVMASIRYNIKIIHRYLEVGHTHMECDSVHATIEKFVKNKDLFTPAQWYAAIRMAKVNRPHYEVKEISQAEIFDFKPLAKHQSWDKIRTSRIREVTVDGAKPGHISYRNQLGSERTLDRYILKEASGRPVNWKTIQLSRNYQTRIAVKPKLLKDLQDLCRKGQPFQLFITHTSLKHCQTFRMRLWNLHLRLSFLMWNQIFLMKVKPAANHLRVMEMVKMKMKTSQVEAVVFRKCILRWLLLLLVHKMYL